MVLNGCEVSSLDLALIQTLFNDQNLQLTVKRHPPSIQHSTDTANTQSLCRENLQNHQRAKSSTGTRHTCTHEWFSGACYSRKKFDVCVQLKFCVKDQLGSAFTLNVPICIRTHSTVHYTEHNMWNEVYPGLRLTTWTYSSKTIYFPSSATFRPIRSSSDTIPLWSEMHLNPVWIFGCALLFAFLWTTWTWISSSWLVPS